jgi:uncharacterized protein YaaQ
MIIMKLIIAIVQDKDCKRLWNTMINQGIRFTKLVSTGGWFLAGNTTFLIGVDDERLSEILTIIKVNCKTGKRLVPHFSSIGGTTDPYIPFPIEVKEGGATVFVVPMDSNVLAW